MAAAAAPPKAWTEAERAEKLRGYVEVPREHWGAVKYGCHVRYVSKHGGFNPGGFIQSNVPGNLLKFHTNFNPREKRVWSIAYDDLEKIYVKLGAAECVLMRTLEAAVAGLNANMRKLADYAKALEARIEHLERRR